jgi:hypothetical protein
MATSAKKQQQFRRSVLITLTAFVWAAALSASFGRFKFAARAPIVVNLATRPEAVKVLVDGKKLFEGRYVKTPVKLEIAPGKRRLKIMREGYVAHVVSIEGQAGEEFKMEDVVMARQANAALVDVSVESQGSDQLYVEIDEGLASGQTPLEADDLMAGHEHVLAIYPKWPETEPRIRCRFNPPAQPNGDEYVIKIRQKGIGVIATGCDRLKPTKKK